MHLLLLIASIFLTTPLLNASTHKPKDYLSGKLSKRDKRYCTFLKALELMGERKVEVIVETGTSRDGCKNFAGDGGSSIIFAKWANDHKAIFYSVDICQNNLDAAYESVKNELRKICTCLNFVCADSITFLKNFGGRIDFLYLDSYDFDEQNPLPSQLHHLYEIQAAYPWLTENSIVMIDDCDLPFGGKGKLAIEYLSNLGWKTIENHYQVILIYPKNNY